MIDTVIFDLDGTLIDTEKYYRIFWPKAMEAFGYHMSDEQALSMRSLGRTFAQQRMEEWFGPGIDYMQVRTYRKKIMEEYLDKVGVELKPGARNILKWLKDNGFVSAIATATDEERTYKYLSKFGLQSSFDRIVCATMVKEGKPAPDIYLYACEELERDPADCIAVEDSPNGILSAYRAGCKAVMIPDQTEPDEELEKLLYARIDNLTQLEELLSAQKG